MLSTFLILILSLTSLAGLGLGSPQGGPPACHGTVLACKDHIEDGPHPDPPLSSRLADCSGFQLVRVTPAPVLTTSTVATVTITVTVTGPVLARLARRQTTVTPTAVPTYLSPGPCPSRASMGPRAPV
ncbi:hypothetical protein BDV25DRAFT_137566 [Aspergillus avenaceus]|uniref:Uncharacterized protein n=1 Tax=Aspergillus avenaceus TaxID=36643 RepID=A0A5N6U2F8_ASPAV|nr:hypothetical protein BDV25DRAFT_137566 [Aspergillus avenaceus]